MQCYIEREIAAEWLEQFEAVGGFVQADESGIVMGYRILGASAADQAEAREMITDLVATPATLRH